jgi:hypothetical protein
MSPYWAPLGWMTGGSVAAWLAVLAVAGMRGHPETLFGMLAPLASANISWLLMARAHAAAPERLMGVMLQGLAAKMVFFGAYVTVMLRTFDLRPVPFVLSFAGFFIALYAMEAHFLRRLLMTGAPPPRG